MGYIVLLVGTPFMDGRYAHEEDALGAAEVFKEIYEGIDPVVVRTKENLIIGDDIFWMRNREALDRFNEQKMKQRQKGWYVWTKSKH
jgi:hypothetical protein